MAGKNRKGKNETGAFTMHADAARNFDVRAEGLFGKLAPIELSDKGPGKYRHITPEQTLTKDDIKGDIIGWDVEVTRKVAIHRTNEKGTRGFVGEDYREFERLIERLSETPPFKNKVSTEFMEGRLFEWLTFVREKKGTTSATSWLLKEAAKEIKTIDVWVPVDDLIVRTPFEIGNVSFFMCDENRFDGLIEEARKKTKGLSKRQERHLRKDWQGKSIGAVSVEAERICAAQVAVARVKQVCMCLEVYFPGAFLPELASSLGPGRHYPIPTEQTMFVRNGRPLGANQHLMRFPNDWEVDEECLAHMRTECFDELDELLREPKSAFDHTVLGVLEIFGKALHENDASDKLVGVASACEMLFGRQNEQITLTVADRMALAILQKPEDRMHVAGVFRAAYDLRSKSVHRGMKTDDYALFKEFLMWARHSIVNAVRNHARVQSKDEWIAAIDRKKYE